MKSVGGIVGRRKHSNHVNGVKRFACIIIGFLPLGISNEDLATLMAEVTRSYCTPSQDDHESMRYERTPGKL